MSTDVELIHADEHARARALDISKSFIVQAPAGSGKTELLIQRYLRLLTIVRQPEEILAITFTNKAATEMQFRVIRALRLARDGANAESGHGILTSTIATEVLARDAEHNWCLIDSPGRMRIQTVDAFGAGIARSLPLSSGLGGAGATLADAGMKSIYRDAAAATLDYLIADDEAGKSVECVLDHLDNNIALYIAYLSRMLSSREQWLSITGPGLAAGVDAIAMRRRLERNIGGVIDRQLTALHSQFPEECRRELIELLKYAAANLRNDENVDHPLAIFVDCKDLPAPVARERNSWQAIVSLLLVKSGDWRKSVNKNDGFPAGQAIQKQRLYDLIEELQKRGVSRDNVAKIMSLPAPEYTDVQWKVLLALFNLLPRAAGELRRLFGERGVTDHSEVAQAADRAFGDPENPGDIAMTLDYKIRHLLVDEMQDTSIAQYQLIKKITAGWIPGDGRTVFCVGDPMQSIYRFRDAEVGEFLLARKYGIGGVELESLLLRQNFRSGENLVHWFNTVFSQVMPIQDDLSVGAISYSDSAPVAQLAGRGEIEIHPLFDADESAEAARTLAVIQRCLSGAGNVAVLVRSRTQLGELLAALRHAAVEYQAIEIDRLTDLPEIIDVLALTRALVHFGDRVAWLALLRGPCVGLTWRDLHALVRNDSNRTVLELCADSNRVADLSVDGVERVRRFVRTIHPFTRRAGTLSLRDRVELAWFAFGGPSVLRDAAEVDNVYRYFSALEKIEVAGSLQDARELEQRLDDERVSSPASPSCRVQVMTMHKAKGLQFDHVVLPGLGRATRRGDKDVLSWLTVPSEQGGGEMLISPVGPKSEMEHDPLHQFIEATEKEKSKMELDRLLYVACTRAIKSLHLIGNVAVTAEGDAFRSPNSGSLLHRLWPAIGTDFDRAFLEWHDASETDSFSGNKDFLVNPVLRRFGEPWEAPVPAALPPIVADSGGGAQPGEKKVDFYWVGSAARHAGTIVHRWLQKISDRQVTPDAGHLDELQPITRRWAIDLGVSGNEIDEVCHRTQSALAGILNDEKGRWILYGEGDTELAVTGLVGGCKESVVIDRVRIDEDRLHWIVDYKTSTHEGGDLDGFLRQEADRYRPQLDKYASLYESLSGERVRTALYFPLLQVFHEVSR